MMNFLFIAAIFLGACAILGFVFNLVVISLVLMFQLPATIIKKYKERKTKKQILEGLEIVKKFMIKKSEEQANQQKAYTSGLKDNKELVKKTVSASEKRRRNIQK